MGNYKLSGTPLAVQILRKLDEEYECGIPLEKAKWAVINAGCLTVGMSIEFMWKKLERMGFIFIHKKSGKLFFNEQE